MHKPAGNFVQIRFEQVQCIEMLSNFAVFDLIIVRRQIAGCAGDLPVFYRSDHAIFLKDSENLDETFRLFARQHQTVPHCRSDGVLQLREAFIDGRQ